MNVGALFLIVVASAVISAGVIVVLLPLLRRHAIAHVNARSSHIEPTPQGGGAAVMIATLGVTAVALIGLQLAPIDPKSLSLVLGAAALLAVVGFIDDSRDVGVVPRFVLQVGAVMMVLAALPSELRIVSALPWWLERALLLFGCLWLVNLTNFMDGIDWMTVAEVVPVAAALGVLGLAGALPAYGVVIALALAGAMLGFAPFNKPIAKLFLGDVGSLPIGLLLGWLLILLAGSGHFTAALLLPLYYIADATITLLRRLLNGERIWEAHRSHFYQRATKAGFKVTETVTRVFAANVALALLAFASVQWPMPIVRVFTLLAAAAIVSLLLVSFSRGKS